MQTTQYWPRVELFPWFREDQIKRLEEKTAHMPEGVRQQSQQELYRQLIPKVIAKQWQEQRMGIKNELYQKNLQKPSEQRQVGEIQLRQEDLADMIKGHFGLRHDLPTEETMQGFQSLMQEEGVEEQLLLDYLNGKNEDLLYQVGIKKRPTPREQGWLRGILSRAGGDWGLGEWVNPIGKATEFLDDLIQKIPTVNFEGREEELKKRIDEVGEAERQNFEEKFNSNKTLQALYGNVDNYIKESKKSFMDQFLGIGDEGPNTVKQFLNVPWSFLKTASGISRALTNPVDTVVGLKNVLLTEEGRQLILDRYGENFQQTLEEDPIGLASDVLSLVGMWGGIVAKGAKLAGLKNVAGNIGKFSAIADGAGNLGLDAAKAGAMQGLETLGAKGGMLGKAVAKGIQIGQEPLKVAGGVAKGIVKALPSAEHTLQNMNRLTKGEQAKFSSMIGESQGEWMNKRGIVAGGETAIDQLADYFVNSKKKVDEALLSIEGEYKNPFLDMMAKESAEFSENTLNKEAGRMKELSQKAETQGLTMSEINEVKRFYEKNNKFTYGKDITAGEKSVRATNIDNNVREWQIDLAEENGFTNLREMNKETQASKFLLDKLVKNTDWSFGNNFFTLTDYITAVGLWDLSVIPWIVAKKILSADWFRTNYAKIVNRINGHQTIAEKIADIEAIKKIQSKKDLEKFLALEYNPEVWDTKTFLGNGEKIIAGKHWSVREGQILEFNSNKNAILTDASMRKYSSNDQQLHEQQTSQIKGGIQENDGEISRWVWLKWNIERSDGKGLGKLREWAETTFQKIEGNEKYWIADNTEKTLSAQQAKQIKNIRNGRSVEEIANDYGVAIEVADKITTPEGIRAYGKYGDGVITLAEKIKEGTAPHELFHATFDMVDHARKESILRQIEKSKGLDSLNAEEYLADSFSEYFRTEKFDTKSFGKGLVGKMQQFFYEVKQFITRASKNKAHIKKLFDEILDGEVDREMLGEILGNKKKVATDSRAQGAPSLQPPLSRYSIQITDKNSSFYKQKFDALKTKLKTDGLSAREFIDEIKLITKNKWNSGYMIKSKNGEKASIRISDHYANAQNNKNRWEFGNNASIVIKIPSKKKSFFKADNEVNLIEYVYKPENLTLKKMENILDSFKEWIDTTEYNDKWYDLKHISTKASLENGEVRYQRVYHGSPYEFEKFDSAHMGKGAGSQAHGWGHYVSIDKEIWKAYADPTQTPGEALRFKWKKGSLYEVEVPDPVKTDTPTKSNYLYESRKLDRDELMQFYGYLKTNKRGNIDVFKEWVDTGHIGDGEDLYGALSYVLGWDKAASLFLKEMGYDGVSYYDVWDWQAYVIFDDAKLEIKKHSKL